VTWTSQSALRASTNLCWMYVGCRKCFFAGTSYTSSWDFLQKSTSCSQHTFSIRLFFRLSKICSLAMLPNILSCGRRSLSRPQTQRLARFCSYPNPFFASAAKTPNALTCRRTACCAFWIYCFAKTAVGKNSSTPQLYEYRNSFVLKFSELQEFNTVVYFYFFYWRNKK
jgi:hypothetical protein